MDFVGLAPWEEGEECIEVLLPVGEARAHELGRVRDPMEPDVPLYSPWWR